MHPVATRALASCRSAHRLGKPALVCAMLILASVMVLLPSSSSALAQEPVASEWELLPLRGSDRLDNRVTRLFTPPGGPLLAVVNGRETYRGDDAGDTWSRVPIPIGADLMAIDPVDPAVMYLRGYGNLYKTADSGRNVEPIYTTPDRISHLAVSPAERTLVYLALSAWRRGDAPAGVARLLRSRDGGLTWETIHEQPGLPECTPAADLLYPHPTDSGRLLYRIGCGTGATPWVGPILQSFDQGTTWVEQFAPPCGTPQKVVGGRGPDPDRLYLFINTVNVFCKETPSGSTLFRADGSTWTPVASWVDTYLGGIANDPEDPDRLYAAVNLRSGRVMTSTDGGLTWTDLGGADLDRVLDLAIGVDGNNLYAATAKGLWRLRLR